MIVTARTVAIRQHGGPEVLEFEDRPVGEPGPGEVRIRHHAIGLNFIDVYQRSGLYKMTLPAALGQEGAGVVEAAIGGEAGDGLVDAVRVVFAADEALPHLRFRKLAPREHAERVEVGAVQRPTLRSG